MDVNCGELREAHIGNDVTLHGWCRYIRDHGGKLFIDIADKHGITQLVFEGAAKSDAEKLGREYMVEVKGVVNKRSDETTNQKMPTGGIEVAVKSLKLLNKSKIPPFELIEEKEKFLANEELRLEYRYLDLRRPSALKRIVFRDKIVKSIRKYFWENEFMELETPVLVRDTYETGSRTFLVPSRSNKKTFYSLAQSPQFYKQMCMVAGIEKYFQVVKCFRDEDAREDRQPEFTQVDLEVAFKDEAYIEGLIEEMMVRVFKEALGKRLKTPFDHLTYAEAMENYGSDKPDLRYANKLVDITSEAKKSSYNILKRVAENNGKVKAIAFSGAKYDQKKGEISEAYMLKIIELAKSLGLKGLTWLYVKNKSMMSEPMSISESLKGVEKELLRKLSPKDGDVIIIGADLSERLLLDVMGKLRKEISQKIGAFDSDYRFVWIDNFPLFEADEVTHKLKPSHNPVTAPTDATLKLLDSDPERVIGKQYDLSLNGEEIAGGSIRISDPELQRKVFKIMGMEDVAERTFGFMFKALSYGTPPHGGIAIGLDRLVALLWGESNIRDFVLFPKNKRFDLLIDGSPSEINPKRLKDDFGIAFIE
ncbi:MAG: aspartate--tRNA ligase [Candidatus Micrarchaeota archaeon]|nr:aspartate--tRNA ligase [Candidatus Micrarchaeota archaeon]MDE1846843.1 aspartate--tRNA ligase [Candidatus Micrarchaeota archaeon]